MKVDLTDNQKAYLVKNGRLIPFGLPTFGKVVISSEDGKVVRINTEESKIIK